MNWFKCEQCMNTKWESKKKTRVCEDCNINMTPLRTQKDAVADVLCNVGLWRKPGQPPEDNREVILLTSFDVYVVRYIDGEWNMPGRHDQQFNEEILGWADKP